MKVIIAGSRTFSGLAMQRIIFDQLDKLRASKWVFDEVVSGAARGPDTIGEAWADKLGITVKRFPANWQEHGYAAGPIRNAEMAEYADAALIFWDELSKGSVDMRLQMERRNKKFVVYIPTWKMWGYNYGASRQQKEIDYR